MQYCSVCIKAYPKAWGELSNKYSVEYTAYRRSFNCTHLRGGDDLPDDNDLRLDGRGRLQGVVQGSRARRTATSAGLAGSAVCLRLSCRAGSGRRLPSCREMCRTLIGLAARR